MYKKIRMRKNLHRIINIKLSPLSDWLFWMTYLTKLTGSNLIKHRSNLLDIIGLVMIIFAFYYLLTISCSLSDQCYYGYTGEANEFINQ